MRLERYFARDDQASGGIRKVKPNAALSKTYDSLAGLINDKTQLEEGELPPFWVEAQKRANEFRTAYESKPEHKMTPKKLAELSSWIQADAASEQPLLGQVAEAYIDFWNRVDTPGHPGHDKRHLFHDLATGLTATHELVKAGSTQMGPYKGAADLGSLMHDFGRLAEVRATGTVVGSEAGKEHPKASFHVMKGIMDHFQDIPQELRDQLCYATLVHQEWLSKPEDPSYKFIMNEPAPRAVAAADRMQLLGVEGVTRFFQFDAGMSNREIAASVDESQKTALNPRQNPPLAIPQHIEYYARTHRPTTLVLIHPEEQAKGENAAIQKANERLTTLTRRSEIESMTFVALGWPHLREITFAPELEVEARGEQGEAWRKENEGLYAEHEKNFLHPEVWDGVKREVEEAQKPGTELHGKIQAKLTSPDGQSIRTLEQLAEELVTPRHAAVGAGELGRINQKLSSVQAEARVHLATALAYILVRREEAEQENTATVQQILNDKVHYSEHGVTHTLAKFVAESNAA